MDYRWLALLTSGGLFAGMLVLLEIGRVTGARRLATEPELPSADAMVGAVFGLLGLLLAFTFSGAASRFDDRRNQIVEEANAIGTAYLRLDLMPASAQPAMRELFRRYLDARLAVYRKLPDVEAAMVELTQSKALQAQIWSQAVAAVHMEGSRSSGDLLLLPALNRMIDITVVRTMAMQMHPPEIIYILLFGLSLAAALLAGHSMAADKSRSWIHMIAFAAVLAVAVNVTINLEHPRLGLVRVDAFDQVLVELRQSMR